MTKTERKNQIDNMYLWKIKHVAITVTGEKQYRKVSVLSEYQEQMTDYLKKCDIVFIDNSDSIVTKDDNFDIEKTLLYNNETRNGLNYFEVRNIPTM